MESLRPQSQTPGARLATIALELGEARSQPLGVLLRPLIWIIVHRNWGCFVPPKGRGVHNAKAYVLLCPCGSSKRQPEQGTGVSLQRWGNGTWC